MGAGCGVRCGWFFFAVSAGGAREKWGARNTRKQKNDTSRATRRSPPRPTLSRRPSFFFRAAPPCPPPRLPLVSRQHPGTTPNQLCLANTGHPLSKRRPPLPLFLLPFSLKKKNACRWRRRVAAAAASRPRGRPPAWRPGRRRPAPAPGEQVRDKGHMGACRAGAGCSGRARGAHPLTQCQPLLSQPAPPLSHQPRPRRPRPPPTPPPPAARPLPASPTPATNWTRAAPCGPPAWAGTPPFIWSPNTRRQSLGAPPWSGPSACNTWRPSSRTSWNRRTGRTGSPSPRAGGQTRRSSASGRPRWRNRPL